ncbi:hypothetical protein ACFQ3P_37415 [Paraburkholderia sabiae]|uniref:Uncharacterized protein n=1 Tax=Paraburkholderia sabiae TaxID=273251 RepID=A0ABU9QQ61_9BURK|nr:hypothetical protein [Paraburkholderia sabiae]WJZ74371.1 hypothetical protein QEN71_00715 [Paraburkholderia sabiae]CAD6562578.1 hypothetical protein LMG24235_07817 [Paraburkholderia sabiae]
MTRDDVIERVHGVTWMQLQSYLIATGWADDGAFGPFASIWHRADHNDAQVLLPISEEADDFWPRLADAVLAIAEFEQRPTADVIAAVSGRFGDVISIRVIHEDVESGTIPAIDGVALNENALELLTAASMSYLTKRQYHQRPTAVTNAFLETLRLGQTEKGSYVVNLFAQLPEPSESQPALDNVHMTNNVIANLSSGLKALSHAIRAKGKRKDEHKALDEAVAAGASANMCDALIGISGRDKNRAFEISITPLRSGGDTPTSVRFAFQKEKIERLEKASEYYRRTYTARNKTVQGYIKRLDRAHGERHGTILVAALVENTEKMVEIDLGPADYKRAISAHASDAEVRCSGDVLIKPRSAILLNPAGFQVVNDGDDLFTLKSKAKKK